MTAETQWRKGRYWRRLTISATMGPSNPDVDFSRPRTQAGEPERLGCKS